MFLEYLTKFHIEDCLKILSEKDNLGYYSINIDQDIIKAQQNILEQEEYHSLLDKLEYTFLKRNVHARFFGLPVCPELHRTVFPKNVDLGCFLKVTGTVVRVTQLKMLEYQRKYICMKCRFENVIIADFEHRYILRAPSKCGNTEMRCKSTNFNQVHMVSREYCKDYQEIKIQEQVNKLSIATIPGSLWVVLEDDLVDCCKPGDDVNICGTVRRRWRPTVQNKKVEVDLVLQANHIEVCNSQRSDVVTAAPDVKECFNEFWSQYQACPLKGRDQILCSVCPQVYGLHLVKLAVLLTVITGSNHIVEREAEKKHSEDRHATRVRGQCHLLLVGDPGTGKSELLRAGAELPARAVRTTGCGSSRAGLTCAALREDGEWQLEAGALVLSDGGVCCIDEISQLREHDRTAIHEAMEQQTISIAKAGIVCKLNTRCAVIAACNPKGRYETDQPLSVNVSLGTPLLSRFDLIFILLDSKNKTWDKLVSSYILFGGSNATDKKRWSLEKLQMYISLVGPRCVEMTKSANTILQSYYMMQRKSEHRDPSRTTVRMLDSLVRLSHAHCRLMYRTTILPVDAVVAVSLVDLSMQDCTLDDTVDALHSTFQKYPDMEYLCTAKKLLSKLNLQEIWRNELLYYAKLLQVDHKTLETSIDSGNCHLFAKYDDVADENTPLSSSIVTSSYFKVIKTRDDDNFEDKENEDNKKQFQDMNVNEKLAATLKKHAALNKSEKKPPTVQKKTRKRKEVTVNVKRTSNINAKKAKRVDNSIESDVSDSDEVFDDSNVILNAVPSVNDVFKNLGIELNFDDEDTENRGCIEESRKVISSDNKNNKHKVELNSNELRDSKAEELTHDQKELKTSNTLSKLKQFKFVEKHDLSKFEEKSDIFHNKTVVKLEKNEESISIDSLKQKPSVSSSQISMFESSDCDIDIDL
ncbi:DNA helicase MCM9-like isoform X2 [Plodia interpunctella]|uniref:DNA helicase MCM9-like isoform X2 n=1 Tax=Plodia interpunctella TaxID=58824 RepID=UPI002367DE71|nr:DNA helicase MCM9-like isoform X2 [Plodia interpunctella]